MFKNPYDNDVTTWSPQGRLYQLEYAMEAVKQGSATIGLQNRKDCAVLAALKRSTSELSAHQKKIILIDQHVGMSIAGLTADARILARYLRNECMNERYAHEQALPVNRLIGNLELRMQLSTQRYDRRPYGVGVLVAGYDKNGPHIYQIEASAMSHNCRAMAIGARSQSARTYLEKHIDSFPDCDRDQIIKHSLLALRECLPNDVELSTKNVSLAIVGKNQPFTTYDDEAVAPFLAMLQPHEKKGRSSGQVGGGSGGGAGSGGSAPGSGGTTGGSAPGTGSETAGAGGAATATQQPMETD